MTKLQENHSVSGSVSRSLLCVCSREATLRRHVQYDHNEDDELDSDGMLDDDRDRDYKPSIEDIKVRDPLPS